jgi:hypothetical protein
MKVARETDAIFTLISAEKELRQHYSAFTNPRPKTTVRSTRPS